MHWRAVAALGFFFFTLLTLWGTYDEAYGSGPPYYNRTVNMDKWSDPTPQLLYFSIPGAVLIIVLILPLFRRR
ncbi:hypothetical protein HNQ39_003600 [Armatimonas rosea]|uniref:Uncharacterized protein n=1 Tax=Armatimonas rosea TaxID=685828 RepID=A0A7W9SSX4_ARMRO|nr:hypothetical protein [Armatimonas rosea]